jgi:succinate-acetate transporter protein
MAAGNTFGATALSSYGGFWISFGIILTPGGFDIAAQYTNPVDFDYALGLFLSVRALIPLLFAQC